MKGSRALPEGSGEGKGYEGLILWTLAFLVARPDSLGFLSIL